MSDNHSARFEELLEMQEKIPLMKNSRRTDWVGRIDQHDVEFPIRFPDKYIAVGNSQFDSLILEGRLQPGEVSLADFDDSPVDFHHDRSLDWVTEDLLERAAVAAADDEDILRPGMANHGWMDEHFVVKELIFLRRLNKPVEEKDATKRFGLDDIDLLKRRPAREETAFSPEKEAT